MPPFPNTVPLIVATGFVALFPKSTAWVYVLVPLISESASLLIGR